MAIKGSLREASLADVCQLLTLGQKTGCLSVTDRSNFGQIYFEKGWIIYATIVNRRDRLGDLLVRDGVLSYDQLRAAVEQQRREPNRPLGQILLEQGLIGREHLEKHLRNQVEEAVYYLFTWTQGNFYFEADHRPENLDLLPAINPDTLLLEGARRVDEWTLIEKKIPSLDLIFQIDRERLRAAGTELTTQQEQILSLLDGSLSVAEIADAAGLSEFDVGQALFALIQAGFAQNVGRRAAPAGGQARETEAAQRRNLGVAFYRTGLTQEATREFEHVLELRPGDVVANFYIALLTMRAGEYLTAVRRLNALLAEAGPLYSVYLNLAVAHSRLEHFDDAGLALDQAEALRASTPGAALLRAAIHLHQGEIAAARKMLNEYRRRLGHTVPAPGYYFHAALSSALMGRHDEAEVVAREGLNAHAACAPLLALAGAIAERKGNLEAAARCYHAAAGEDPQIPQTHKCLGDVALQRGQHEEALEHYRKALQLSPDIGDDVYARIGALYYERHEREEALRCWNRALDLNPHNETARRALAAAHARA